MWIVACLALEVTPILRPHITRPGAMFSSIHACCEDLRDQARFYREGVPGHTAWIYWGLQIAGRIPQADPGGIGKFAQGEVRPHLGEGISKEKTLS